MSRKGGQRDTVPRSFILMDLRKGLPGLARRFRLGPAILVRSLLRRIPARRARRINWTVSEQGSQPQVIKWPQGIKWSEMIPYGRLVTQPMLLVRFAPGDTGDQMVLIPCHDPLPCARQESPNPSPKDQGDPLFTPAGPCPAAAPRTSHVPVASVSRKPS